MKKITLGSMIVSLLFIFLAVNSYAQNEQLVITTYYPSPSGSYNELGVDKLAVNVSGDLDGNRVALPSEFLAMNVGDAHIGWSMIVGSGGTSGFAYDEIAAAGLTPPQDGDVLISGEVGIGTNANVALAGFQPHAKLEVLNNEPAFPDLPQLRLAFDNDSFSDFLLDANDDLTITPTQTGGVRFQPTTDSTDFFQVMDADGGNPILNVDALNERVGIGTASPNRWLDLSVSSATEDLAFFSNNIWNAAIEVSAAVGFTSGYYLSEAGALRAGYIYRPVNAGAGLLVGGTGLFVGGTDRVFIQNTGNVGIATTDPAYRLDVNGSIRAIGSVFYGGTEGNADGTAYTTSDYVFKPGYNTLKTAEVEAFLKDKGHLPWMVSAEQERIENNGAIDMTRMAFQTVETAENLQLQIIELNKVIESQQESISRLEEKIEKLAGRI